MSSSSPPPSPSEKESKDHESDSPPPDKQPSPEPSKDNTRDAKTSSPSPPPVEPAASKPKNKELDDDDKKSSEPNVEESNDSQEHDDDPSISAAEVSNTTAIDEPNSKEEVVDKKNPDGDDEKNKSPKEEDNKEEEDTLEDSTNDQPSPTSDSATTITKVDQNKVDGTELESNLETKETDDHDSKKHDSSGVVENEIKMDIGDKNSEKKNENDINGSNPTDPKSAPDDTQKDEPAPTQLEESGPSSNKTDCNESERKKLDEAKISEGNKDDAKAAIGDSSSGSSGDDDTADDKMDQPGEEEKIAEDFISKKASNDTASDNQDGSAPTPMSLDSANESGDGNDDAGPVHKPPADPKKDPLPPLSLHDCVSLGEIELGLAQDNKAAEEIRCLPLLLRLLSLTRPLSTVDILQTSKEEEPKPSSPSSGDSFETGGDPLVNGLVARLEHVAATHSMAEGVDVVTCHLAPSMSRKLSKLPPLTMRQDGRWDTAALSAVARSPIPSSHRGSKRRRLSMESTSNEVQPTQSDDGIEGSSEDEDETTMIVEEQPEGSASNKRRRMYSLGGKRDSFGPGDKMAAEDSQEATFTKTLSELASLVASSLEPLSIQDTAANVEEAQPSEHPQTRGGQFSLTIDDSILAEAGIGSDEGVGGAMARSDLGSTVASIMHHSPVLRSRHVANALCRAAIPQVGDLLKRMGANCPASIPCLLRGCTDAYSSAILHDNPSIASAAKKGVMALAKLSPRERSRVQSTLSGSFRSSMLDVQLKLALEAENSTSVCCLLIRNLSRTGEMKSLASQRAAKSTQLDNEHEKSKESAENTSSGFRHHLERGYHQGLQGRESSLRRQLKEDARLLERTLEYFIRELQNLAEGDTESTLVGKLCLVVASIVWLLLAVCSPNNVALPRSSGSFSKLLVDKLIPELDRLLEFLKAKIPESETTPEVSSMDRAFCLAQVAIIVAWSTFLQLNGEDATTFGNECCSILIGIRSFPSLSKVADGFVASLAWLITKDDTAGLHAKIMEVLFNSDDYRQKLTSNMYYPTIERGLKLFCKNVGIGPPDTSAKVSTIDYGSDIFVQISTLLLETQAASQGDSNVVDKIKHMLKRVLTSVEIGIEAVIGSDEIAKFVAESTHFLARSSMQPHVPAILHVQIEVLGSKLEYWRLEDEKRPLNQHESQFLLQLLHAFEFMDRAPQSPFVISPRGLPIRHALKLCGRLTLRRQARFLTSKLQDQIRRHVPDVYLDNQVNHSLGVAKTNLIERHMSGQEICASLLGTIRACIEHYNPDKYAPSLEGLFLLARRQLPDSDLSVSVASALLASPNKPPTFFTYTLLCEDPLVLLKCPMKVWHCRGLRRVTLAILCSLLEANAIIVMETSPSDSSAEEILAARNAVVLRCLLISMSGADSGIPTFFCSMTTSVVRWLVASQPGLVAIVIKQGLPDAALDWLIEFVPETMGDSQDLIHLISDRSSLTPAERLVAADAVLRIAIAHGHSNEVEAQGMAYTALAQLVNCFFLVVGPVGVPVNALVGDGSGLDVTQISRNAAFRILKSLLKVRGKRERLRNECGMALQKLANLCKGETVFSGVAGAVAGRRKNLLKEIFDAVMKAVNSMGSTVGSQSVAA